MKYRLLFSAATLLLLSTLIWSCGGNSQEQANSEQTAMSDADKVKRGEYLVNALGCADCHSPKKFGPEGITFDTDRMFMGHPSDMPLVPADSNTMKNYVLAGMHFTSWVGPWGVSFAGNITSDPTGIGNWTPDQFKKALREGKYKGLDGARSLLPPMPWENFAKMTDEDIESIFMYLKTTKPINNVVPAPKTIEEFMKGA